ncbi:hypothetical protein HD806DRAFT_532584 [Xylariaceae sp. AK1471]|nr:hypothetical protein HD806DRAFT_532584 [Xylariaceae sp. AK1471]
MPLYLERPSILRLSLSYEPDLDSIYNSLYTLLSKHALLSRVTISSALAPELQNVPDVILITDGTLTEPHHKSSLSQVLKYVRNSGIAICLGNFSDFVGLKKLDAFFKEAGLAWEAGPYYRSDTKLITAGMPARLIHYLPPNYSQTALHITGTTARESWYSEKESQYDEAAVALGLVEKGRIGYIGDVRGEQETNDVILRMCDLHLNRRPRQDSDQILHPESSGEKCCLFHGIVSCPLCRYLYDSGAQSLPDSELDSEDDSEDLGELPSKAFPPHLHKQTNRFIPQEDKQMRGGLLHYDLIQRISDNSLKPAQPCDSSMQGVFQTCDNCQLSWLVSWNYTEDETSHPDHNASELPNSPYPWRSLLVQVDGTCLRNGSGAETRAAVGVYFAANSKYNVSRLIKGQRRHTNQTAELEAAYCALWTIKEEVIPDRRRAFLKRLGREGQALKPHDELRLSEVGLVDFRVIVQTDSLYLVECFCKHMSGWQRGSDGKWVNRRGEPINNSDHFDAVKKQIDELAKYGVSVVWYHVERRFNREADHLANEALRR